ncbi:MAG: HEAT repeat domain-containing protein [Thermodesulfobacteriota bacterium]
MAKRKIIIGALVVLAVLAVAATLYSTVSRHKLGADSAGGDKADKVSSQPASSAGLSPAAGSATSAAGAGGSSQTSSGIQADGPLSPEAQKAFDLAVALTEVHSNYGDHSSIMQQIVALGPDAVPGLAAFLRRPPPAGDLSAQKRDYNARIGVMNLLGEIGDPQALPVLAEILRDAEQPSSINTAGRNIGRIGGKEAFAVLSETLAEQAAHPDESSQAREMAVVLALGLCGDRQAVPPLQELLKDTAKPERTRVYAAGSLGMLGDSSGLALATKSLDSEDYYLAIASARSLGVIADPSSIKVLKEKSESANNLLLKEEIKLSLFQVEAAQKPGDEKVAYIKEQLLKHPSYTPFVQWGTMELAKMNTAASRQALEEMAAMKDTKDEVLSWAAKIRNQR